jgi:integrase
MVDPPSPHKNPMRTLTAAEVEVLLNSVKESNYYPVIYTALSTGLRQAEILGLRWRDIDLDLNSISVSQVLYIRKGEVQFKEPKTAHSRRRVLMTPKLAMFLKIYRARREQYYIELGKPLTLDNLVFTTIEGKPIDAHILSRAFGRLAQNAGLGYVRFHDLRHTFATLMFLHGAKPKVISEALGHASVGFTMDVYSHIIEGM